MAMVFGLHRVLTDRSRGFGLEFWQKNSGYPGDIISFGREKWGNWANWARGSDRSGSTGNRAFDEWSTTELAGWKKNARSSSRRWL
jgi:hypothetical protein